MRAVLSSLTVAAALALAAAAPFVALSLLGGASLVEPVGLALAALAIPLVLLFLLRPSRPRRPVASVLLWRAVARDQQAGTPFQRLRRNLPLLLLLLALGALTYARARPVLLGKGGGRSVVLLIDTSASMLARDADGRSRLEAAREQALAEVARLGPGDEACLATVDRSARLLVDWTRDRAALTAALERVEARHLPTQLAEGLLLAAGLGRGDQEVHLFSDGGGPPPPPLDLGGALRHRSLGSSGENLALTAARAQVRRGGGEAEVAPGEGLAHEVFVNVRNAGTRDRSVFVALEREGAALAARRVEVAAGSATPVVLEARLPPGPISVRLRGTSPGQPLDVQLVDDAAWLVIPERRGVEVALVAAGEAEAIERALLAAGAEVRRVEPQALSHLDPSVRLVVGVGVAPGALPPRDCLLFDPPAPVGPAAPGPEAAAPRVAGWDRGHPLLRYVDPAEVSLLEARPLTLGPGARVLVQGEGADGAPLVLVGTWSDGEAWRVAVGFDPERSTWPLRASFPIFIKNCLTAAASRGASGDSATVGEPVTLPVPPGHDAVTVIDPRGERHEVPVRGGYAPFADTLWAGIYRLQAAETPLQTFAVATPAEAEADIGPRPVALPGATAGEAQERQRTWELTPWLAALALVVLTLEVWVSHRRW